MSRYFENLIFLLYPPHRPWLRALLRTSFLPPSAHFLLLEAARDFQCAREDVDFIVKFDGEAVRDAAGCIVCDGGFGVEVGVLAFWHAGYGLFGIGTSINMDKECDKCEGDL